MERPAALFIVLGLVALAFLPALQNGFVTDDNALVLKRAEVLRSGHGLVDLVSNVYWWGTGDVSARHDLYRPLVSATWWLDYRVSGIAPFGYHFSNYAVHLANTALVFAVLAPIAGPTMALGIAALFGVGPVAVTSVGWASGRTDLWETFFVLLFLLFFFRARERSSKTGWILACVSFFLALASKEGAVVAPLVAFMLDRSKMAVAHPVRAESHRWRPYLYLLIPLAAYLLVRLAAIGAVLPRDVSTSRGIGDEIRILAEAFIRSAAHVLVPLHYRYWSELPWSAAGEPGIGFIAVWVVFVALVALIIYGLYRRRLWAAGGAWFGLILLPVYLSGQHWAPQSDFYLYLGLPGLWLFAMDGIREFVQARLPGKIKPAMAANTVAALVLVFAILTFVRLPILKSDFTLAAHMVQREPHSVRALMSMGEQYFVLGDGARGAEYMRQAAAVNPENLQPWMKSASFFLSRRDLTGAAPYVDTLAARGAGSNDALGIVGRFYFEAGQCDKAVTTYRKSLALGTPTANTLYDYGMALLCVGDNETAGQVYRTALQVRPSWPEALMNLGLAAENLNHLADAQAAYVEALRQNPQLAEGWESLAIVNVKRGNLPAARSAADRYYQLSPPRERVARLQNLLNNPSGQINP
jgi:tetratricopeptide (TPR) repeat protein